MGRGWLLLVCCLVAAGVLSSPGVEGFWGSGCPFNRTHNRFFGRRSYYDRLLYTNQTFRSSSFWGRTTVDLEFPERGRFPRGTISYVEALDQRRDSGSCAELRRGGPGFNFLRLRLVAAWNRNLHFVVNVFGN